jgi:signal transduction histidine kinase
MRLMICAKKLEFSYPLWYSSAIDEKTRYNSEFEMKMYFIIMELLNNVIKHSNAENTTLSLQEVKWITDSRKG